MPERKRFNGRGWRPAQYVADVVPMSIRSVHGHKKWPRNPGPLVESISPRSCRAQKTTASETLHLQASEPEIGKVPIAQRGTGRGHQRTVDGGHQAAEQGGGGREADGSSLGHCRPLSKARRIAASGLGRCTYTRYQPQRGCLHSSIL